MAGYFFDPPGIARQNGIPGAMTAIKSNMIRRLHTSTSPMTT